LKLNLIIPLVISLTITSICIGQNNFTFKKWKSKQVFSEKLIIFQVDTSLTKNEAHQIVLAIDRTSTNLKPFGFDFKLIPYPSDTIVSKDILFLKFDKLPTAYVQLKGNPKLPLCSRMEMTQVNAPKRKKIETKIAISIPNFEQGVKQLGLELAEKLKEHFTIEE
jgi:hypothetical protein